MRITNIKISFRLPRPLEILVPQSYNLYFVKATEILKLHAFTYTFLGQRRFVGVTGIKSEPEIEIAIKKLAEIANFSTAEVKSKIDSISSVFAAPKKLKNDFLENEQKLELDISTPRRMPALVIRHQNAVFLYFESSGSVVLTGSRAVEKAISAKTAFLSLCQTLLNGKKLL